MQGRRVCFAPTFVSLLVLAAALGAGAAQGAVLWFSSDPAVVRVGAAAGPNLRFQLDSPADTVAIVPTAGQSIPLSHEGGNIWSVTLTASQALSGYVPPRVNQLFLGFLTATTGGTAQNVLNVCLLVADASTPPVPVVQLSPSMKRTARVVNLLVPDLPLAWTPASGRAASFVSSFLATFGDEYDFVQVVYASPEFVENRYHMGVRNAVQGTGHTVFDVGSTFGSASRLLGVTVYPNLTFFNNAEEGFSHETGHQWVNYSTHPSLHPGSPHWPASTMARGIMGLSIPGSGAGGAFPYEIQQSGGAPVWHLTSTTGEFNDLDLYYAGLYAPGEVAPQSVAGDPSVAACNGCPVAGGVATVTIGDVVSAQGARSPDAASTRRTQRFVNIVVSRNRLLTDDELSYLDAMSARGEATTPQTVSMGLTTGTSVKPWRLATRGRGTAEIRLVPPGSGARDADRVVPVVLDVTSRTRYTTELSLRNLSAVTLPLTVTYTASLGSGSGSKSDSLAPGEQRIIPDAIAWLRSKGLAIPTSGSQAGTLAFQPPWSLPGPHPLAVTARTTSPVAAPLPAGFAGLAYSAAAPSTAFFDSLTIYGLRENERERSNVAVLNPGTVPVTVRITAVSGDSGARTVTHDAMALSPGAWTQVNGALAEAGYANGWVVVDRTSPSGSFSAYGVVNDNTTDDGSFVQPVGGTFPGSTLTLPVLVEGPVFRSELVLANRSSASVTFRLEYKESAHPERGAGGTVNVVVPPGIQRILQEAVAYLRTNGAAIGASGGDTLAGAVRVTVTGAPLADVFVGARTAAQVPSGTGQFGLFYGAVPPGREAGSDALVPGLRAGATLRSNVAVVNAGSNALGAVTLELQTLDGTNSSVAWGAPVTVTLQPGQWAQPLSLTATAGPSSASVRIRRTSGTAPWIAYGVVNDGGAPGERTGDGAFVDMVVP